MAIGGSRLSLGAVNAIIDRRYAYGLRKHVDCSANDMLTRTGPGTPMGDLMREY